jgi:high-affinity nickel permease
VIDEYIRELQANRVEITKVGTFFGSAHSYFPLFIIHFSAILHRAVRCQYNALRNLAGVRQKLQGTILMKTKSFQKYLETRFNKEEIAEIEKQAELEVKNLQAMQKMLAGIIEAYSFIALK